MLRKPPSPPDQLLPASRLLRERPAPESQPGPRGAALDDTPDAAAPRLPPPPRAYERPAIIRTVELDGAVRRRQIIIASLGAAAEACDSANIDITTAHGDCTCHAVCTCDLDDESHDKQRVTESQYSGTACTCDTVCSCDSVCTCDTVSSGDSGGSTTYWY